MGAFSSILAEILTFALWFPRFLVISLEILKSSGSIVRTILFENDTFGLDAWQAEYNSFSICVFPVPFSPIKTLIPLSKSISVSLNTVKFSILICIIFNANTSNPIYMVHCTIIQRIWEVIFLTLNLHRDVVRYYIERTDRHLVSNSSWFESRCRHINRILLEFYRFWCSLWYRYYCSYEGKRLY